MGAEWNPTGSDKRIASSLLQFNPYDNDADPATARAVLVSGLITIAGFGVLSLARHLALQSLGLTVLLGFGAAVPVALFVIPALQRKK